jgi:CBS domain-containing protein
MKITDVMTPNPRTCQPHSTVQDAATLMRDEDVGAIPVVEGGRVIGMVTDRDIVVRCLADGGTPDRQLREFCSGDVVTARPDMSAAEASDLMSENQIRRLPVVDDEGKLVGIVSLGDLAVKVGKDRVTGDALENISEGVKRH